jgi:uncharacterized protein YkwD
MLKNTLKEKISMNKAMLIAAVFVFSLSFTQTVWASEINSGTVIKLVNEARHAIGLEPLIENSKLSIAAEDKAQDMIANNYFAHTSPAGVSPWFWIEKNNYDYNHAGENLAMNFKESEAQQEAWMKSEKHRQNILNPLYKEIGIAVKQGIVKGQMTIITVQMFGAQTKIAFSANPIPPAISESHAQPVENFSRSSDLPVNLNGGKSGVESLVAQYDILKNQKVSLENQNVPAVLYKNQEYMGKFAWAISILVLLLVLAVNFMMLSGMHERSASPVVNAAILIIMLTAMVMWRM